ncbi:GTPase-activating protein skywalker isoform X1 [Hetaerina americana]|uniref:GTPase-activating protein skywalker isoform X1 n=1 Tax=Hetaerina americana TaxID=62018 RepID=UPI003A7F3169
MMKHGESGNKVIHSMLSVLEEESDIYEIFPDYVDTSSISILSDSPVKKGSLKTFQELQALIQAGKKRELKQIIRENSWPINSSIRKQLWPLLCQQHAQDKTVLEGFYWDMVKQIFGTTDLPEKSVMLPPFVEGSHCLAYHLTRKGKIVAERVVAVIGYSCPDITYSPTLFPITAILLHFMSEEECYNCMTSLVKSDPKAKETFITQTKLLYEVTWRTAMQISKKHVKSATSFLLRQCPNNTKVEHMFQDWMWWIFQGLPFHHLVRVIDCFLNEGIKVFYRVAMAILVLFHKNSGSSPYSSSPVHTQNSNASAHPTIPSSSSTCSSSWLQEISLNGVEAALNKFCRQMPVSPSKLLRTAFGIRALRSVYISRVFVKTEMSLRSRTVLSGNRQLVRSRSSDNLPTSQSQVNVQMMSHTMTIREGSTSPGPRAPSMGTYPIQAINSQILEQEALITLWSWLPVRITMYQPILLYTTEEHGCSLTTFFVRVEQHEPTILIVKTSNGETFGAYCSTRWVERNLKDDRGNRQAYFGTGETFVFSLLPERHRYPWVGLDRTTSGERGGDHFDHAAELFMAADSKMLTVGGGEGQAIWMDENIRFGKTERCQTFDNPPLCESGDFEIRVLEVYGFSGA